MKSYYNYIINITYTVNQSTWQFFISLWLPLLILQFVNFIYCSEFFLLINYIVRRAIRTIFTFVSVQIKKTIAPCNGNSLCKFKLN